MRRGRGRSRSTLSWWRGRKLKKNVPVSEHVNPHENVFFFFFTASFSNEIGISKSGPKAGRDSIFFIEDVFCSQDDFPSTISRCEDKVKCVFHITSPQIHSKAGWCRQQTPDIKMHRAGYLFIPSLGGALLKRVELFQFHVLFIKSFHFLSSLHVYSCFPFVIRSISLFSLYICYMPQLCECFWCICLILMMSVFSIALLSDNIMLTAEEEFCWYWSKWVKSSSFTHQLKCMLHNNSQSYPQLTSSHIDPQMKCDEWTCLEGIFKLHDVQCFKSTPQLANPQRHVHLTMRTNRRTSGPTRLHNQG